MRVRVEYWKLSTANDGVHAVLHDYTVEEADEFTADTTSPVELPVQDTYVNYAALVISLEGNVVVDISQNPSGDTANGRLISEGTEHWFLVNPGDKLTITTHT